MKLKRRHIELLRSPPTFNGAWTTGPMDDLLRAGLLEINSTTREITITENRCRRSEAGEAALAKYQPSPDSE